MTTFRLLPTHLQCSLRYGPERIEIVQINAIQLVDSRIDITRHCPIDHKKGPVPASSQDRSQFVRCDNRVRSRRSAYQDIQVAKFSFPVLEMNSSPPVH